MLIGYVRVSKSDGTQTLSPQRDALLAAGVEPERIYEDLASGRSAAEPGLAACLKALQPGNTLVLWKVLTSSPVFAQADPRFRRQRLLFAPVATVTRSSWLRQIFHFV